MQNLLEIGEIGMKLDQNMVISAKKKLVEDKVCRPKHDYMHLVERYHILCRVMGYIPTTKENLINAHNDPFFLDKTRKVYLSVSDMDDFNQKN